MGDRVLVTGANGCIGAWVVKLLCEQGTEVIAFDLSTDDHRHRLINDGDVPDVRRIEGDLTVQRDVVDAAEGVSHIIHLAALQVPFCRANPAQGAAVNVTGTVNVFEAAQRHGVTQIAQASSIAVYGTSAHYDVPIIPPDSLRRPTTLYGVYKVATEDLAAVYWAEHGVRSVCLRPHTVFGPGRDQGMTSLPSIAIERAVRCEPFHIDFGGSLDFQFARDVAASFIHAMRVDLTGAPTFNLGGTCTTVAEFVDTVASVTGFDQITFGGPALPVIEGADASDWFSRAGGPAPTPLREAIEASARTFESQRTELP
jgi:nucleoside-diphosphate-sugar epimerase